MFSMTAILWQWQPTRSQGWRFSGVATITREPRQRLNAVAAWIWRKLTPSCCALIRVNVYRDSEGGCSYFGPISDLLR